MKLPSKTAIAGAGVTGAYLSAILRRMGHEIDLYDIDRTEACGLTPCAWGTSRGFEDLVSFAGLDPGRYILQRFDYIIMDGIRLGADLMTFDKPRLIRDLIGTLPVSRAPLETGRYDRIIDATGVSRAMLPRIEDDLLLSCVQCRIRTERPLENSIKLGCIGYSWCFPLSRHIYHVGCGTLTRDPRALMKELGYVDNTHSGTADRIVCECSGSVRLTSPHGARPFVAPGGAEGIWGVGEAIGCVAPLAGDGILAGMRSAQILAARWNDPVGYTAAILEEFKWMKRERGVIDKLRNGGTIGLSDALVLKENSRRMGMKISPRDAFSLLSNLS
jgi:flavin-dependent dehydrogenase